MNVTRQVYQPHASAPLSSKWYQVRFHRHSAKSDPFHQASPSPSLRNQQPNWQTNNWQLRVTVPISPMPHWKLILTYDGTPYNGWQIQPNLPTIQGTLAHAIHHITGETVLPQGSGRTDTGVHALAQVATFSLAAPIPAANLRRALRPCPPPQQPNPFPAIRPRIPPPPSTAPAAKPTSNASSLANRRTAS